MAGQNGRTILIRLAVGGVAGLAATYALRGAAGRIARFDPAEDGWARAAPFLYGFTCGALLALADRRPSKLGGALVGGGLWLAGETGLLPKMRIGPARGRPGRHALALLAGQLAWGWSAAGLIAETGDFARR